MKKMSVFLVLFFSVVSCFSLDAGDFSYSWGLSTRRGERKTMEDTHIIQADNNFFALFDGHGGAGPAQLAQAHLYYEWEQALKETPIIQEDPFKSIKNAFEKSFLAIDKKMCTNYKQQGGTTALAAYVHGSTLYLAWSGDSRALVIRQDMSPYATDDHKPHLELDRLKEVDASLIDDPCCEGALRIGRKNVASLAVSRALGDTLFKQLFRGIIPDPDVRKVDVKPGDIIVLACDGLWDVFDNRDIVSLVNYYKSIDIKKLEELYPRYPQSRSDSESAPEEKSDFLSTAYGKNSRRMMLIARALRDEAYKRFSTDNISVLVIQLQSEKEKKEASGSGLSMVEQAAKAAAGGSD